MSKDTPTYYQMAKHKCCLCNRVGADAYCETADGNLVYFHRECFEQELPRVNRKNRRRV